MNESPTNQNSAPSTKSLDELSADESMMLQIATLNLEDAAMQFALWKMKLSHDGFAENKLKAAATEFSLTCKNVGIPDYFRPVWVCPEACES